MNNSIPKVLIIGVSFTQKDGGGITLTNLFKDWPLENLAVTSEEFYEIDLNACKNYYRLGFKENRRPWPFYYFQPVYKSEPIKVSSEPSSPVTKEYFDSYESKYNSFIKQFLTRLLHITGLYNYIFRLRVSENFLNWFDEYNPDIIYTQLASLPLIRFVNRLTDLRKRAMVIHFMDDWPTTINQKGIFSFYWGNQIDKGLRKLIQKASVNMSICQYMSDEYKNRYGKNFVPFHNFIEPETWKNVSKTDWVSQGKFKILYAGRISIGVKNLIFKVSEAVEYLNTQGYNIELQLLVFWTSKKFDKKISTYKSVKVLPHVDHSEIPKSLTGADLLLLPLDFDKKSLKFTHLSMPTKASEYMISGTPILAIAHESTALYNYAKNSGWAYVLNSENQSDIIDAIKTLVNNIEIRKNLGETAKSTALKLHNSSILRSDFQHILKDSIAKNNL